jgi:hypothetical protein
MLRFGLTLLLGLVSLLPPLQVPANGFEFTPYIDKHPHGWIDWDTKVIYGIGRGYLDRNDGSRAGARRSARIIALQSILELAAGVNLDDRHTLEMLGRRRATIEIRALVHFTEDKTGFVPESPRPYYETILKTPMTGIEGLTSRLLKALKRTGGSWQDFPRPSSPDSPEEETAPWLVLDARSLPSAGRPRPALFPRILSASGEILYDLNRVDESALIDRGMARFVCSDELRARMGSGGIETGDIAPSRLSRLLGASVAIAGEKSGRQKPQNFIVKDVESVQGLSRTNLVISERDARGLKSEDAASKILERCRVIVIVSSPAGRVEGILDRSFAGSPGD